MNPSLVVSTYVFAVVFTFPSAIVLVVCLSEPYGQCRYPNYFPAPQEQGDDRVPIQLFLGASPVAQIVNASSLFQSSLLVIKPAEGRRRFQSRSLCRQHRLICRILDIHFISLNEATADIDGCRKRSIHGVENRGASSGPPISLVSARSGRQKSRRACRFG